MLKIYFVQSEIKGTRYFVSFSFVEGFTHPDQDPDPNNMNSKRVDIQNLVQLKKNLYLE